MKKLLIMLLVSSAATMGAKAQEVYVQGGLNLSNITKSEDGQTESNNILPTFNAGGMVRFGISKMFDIESGLLFTGRGSKSETYFTSNKDDNYVKSKFNAYYIELPLNAVVKLPLTAKGKSNVFFHAGPYVAMGITGKSKVEQKFLGVTSTSTNDVKFNDDDPTTSQQEDAAYDKLKRFDFGANVGGGVDLGPVLFKVNYGIGFAKINSKQADNSEDEKNKYRTLSFTVGIPLGR